MRKTLVFVVVAILLSTVVLSISSEDFTNSFEYKQTGLGQIINDIWLSILNFFEGGITGFTGYTPGTNYNLTIWDDSDFGVKYIDEDITFFANLTDGTGPVNDSLANLSICINFPQVLCANMSYDSFSELWQFNTSPFYSGTFRWFVNETSSVENLNANDTVVLGSSCLNASGLSGDYYLKTSRVLCSGSHNLDFSIIIANISSVSLNCNNSVLIVNNSNFGIVLFNTSNISVRNCRFRDSENSPLIILGIGANNVTLSNLEFTNVNGSGINITDSRNVYVSNCSFNSSGSPVFFENASYSSVSNCAMFNSSSTDVNIKNSVYVNITNVTSNFNNDSTVAVVIGGSNFTRTRNLRVYNAHSLFGFAFGSLNDFSLEGFNNYLADSYFENVSNPTFGNASAEFMANNSISSTLFSGILEGMGFGAVNEVNLVVDGIIVKNQGICGGAMLSSNVTFTNLQLSNCRFFGAGVVYVDAAINVSNKKFVFENFSINNSGVALAFYGDDVVLASPSSVSNINIYNATYAVALETVNISNVLRNINVLNTQTVVYAINSSANIINSTFSTLSSARLQNGSTVTFINVTFDRSLSNFIFDTSRLYVGWFFNVLVQDTVFGNVENANVTLSNTSSDLFSELTNSSGNIPWQNIPEYFESAAGRNNLSYNITVDTVGYSRYNATLRVQNNTIYDVIVSANSSITIYSPVNGGYYKNRTINLTYNILFNNTDQCWYLNSTGSRINLPGCANTTLNAKEGYNNITVFANSTDGDLTYSRVLFYADTISPTLTRLNISLVTNVSVLLNWTTSEETNASFKYWKGNESASSGFNSSFVNRSAFIISALSERTVYKINATFCDRAGNCVLKAETFETGSGNYSPSDLHIPEADIIVQELVASELTAAPQRSTLTPGSRYIYTIDTVRHEVKLKYVYMEERAVFEFSSEPVTKEIPKGNTTEVDLDNDGINDVALTVNSIELTKVNFDLKRISFKKQETVPAEEKPKEETPGLIVPSVLTNGTGKPKEKTFLEKYGWYMLISLSVIIAVVVAGGAVLMKRKMPVVIEIEQRKKLAPPKTSHLESLMKNVYAMLGDNKAELDVQKYLEDLNFEDNVIKSIVFEMKTKNNKIDQMISFAKKQFDKEKSVEEVREILENAGWAKNIVKLATEE